MENDPHYLGHRKRLKDRALNGDIKNFADYELLELLLFYIIPRRDVKPLAKELIKEFGNVNKIIDIDKEKLLTVKGVNNNLYVLFEAIRELIHRSFQEKLAMQNIISSWSTLIDYLKLTIGKSSLEQFRVLFLNKKNILIKDELMWNGTIDEAPVYPREVAKKALFYDASAIILVHNHPSGNSKPSKADIDVTKQIKIACEVLNIAIHDHIIIADNDYFSFKSNLLL